VKCELFTVASGTYAPVTQAGSQSHQQPRSEGIFDWLPASGLMHKVIEKTKVTSLTYLLTYLLIYLLNYLLTYLLTYLLLYLLTYLLTCLTTYLLTCLLTCSFTYLPTYLLAYLLTYLLAYLLAPLLTYLLTYLLTHWLNYLPASLSLSAFFEIDLVGIICVWRYIRACYTVVCHWFPVRFWHFVERHFVCTFQSSVETVITTLDPGMKDVICTYFSGFLVFGIITFSVS